MKFRLILSFLAGAVRVEQSDKMGSPLNKIDFILHDRKMGTSTLDLFRGG